MLVIRRRAGERFLIGDDIEVEILGIEGSQVRLGIRAPRHIPVLRSEVLLTQQANVAASSHASEKGLSQLLTALRTDFSQKSQADR